MFSEGNYKLVSNWVNYKMSKREKAIFLDGIFKAISDMNSLANGDDLSQADRLKLDLFWQYIEMGASSEMFKRAIEE